MVHVAHGAVAPRGSPPFDARWLHEHLAITTPRELGPRGIGHRLLAREKFELAVGGVRRRAGQGRPHGRSKQFYRGHEVSEVGRQGAAVRYQKVGQTWLSYAAGET